MANISIDLTESDLLELMAGETFNWSYPTEDGTLINVHLYNSDLEEME